MWDQWIYLRIHYTQEFSMVGSYTEDLKKTLSKLDGWALAGVWAPAQDNTVGRISEYHGHLWS